MKKTIIVCPNCKTEIDVEEVLYFQIEKKLKNSLEKEYNEKKENLKKEREIIEREKENIQKRIEKEVNEKISEEKKEMEKKLKKQIEDSFQEQIKILNDELSEKTNKIKELNRTKAEIERLKREKDELKDKITLELEKKYTEQINEEKRKIEKNEQEKNYLVLKEKEKIIEDLKKQLEEAQRKAEQGSVQLQGEVQELEIENLLKETFFEDKIEPIKKGERGADILQTVIENGFEIGRIYYESKRTKNFKKEWIKKFKEDNLEKKADILVLVTEVFPEGQKSFFNQDGVWICSLKELKGVAFVLRFMLIQVYYQKKIQTGKKEKSEIVYEYLTSVEFKNQFESIVAGFLELQKGYNEEKNKIQKIWKEREKQLEKILSSTIGIYGSLKGYIGSSMKEIKQLEFEEND